MLQLVGAPSISSMLSTSLGMQRLSFKIGWKCEQGLWQECFVLEVRCQDSTCAVLDRMCGLAHTRSYGNVLLFYKYHNAQMSDEGLK